MPESSHDHDAPTAPHGPGGAELARIAGDIAREVGELIHARREAGVAIATTKSSLTDVVTAADREAETLVVTRLTELRPEDGILGEEGAERASETGITWVVDPIDGTVNYLYGLPAYAVSIAATVVDDRAPGALAGNTHDGRRAIAGAVYLPVTRELFVAHEGGGATRNGDPIAVSEVTELGVALVATGFGYTVERRTEQAEVVRQIIPLVRDIRRLGSAAVDLCLLASGRLDGYYERGLQPWDYAAGALVAREAGAVLLGRDADTLPGEPLLVAGPPALASRLREAIRTAYAALD